MERNLNGIFVNKYSKIWCRMGNTEYFNLGFCPFVNMCLCSLKFLNINRY
jgi:hypothetical protein